MVREGRPAATPDAAPRTLRLQLYSDLHLETETFEPEPVAGADLLVLAGDIDATWRGYERFAGWPVPILAVAGNHEFDGREWLAAWPALREMGERFGIRWLEQQSCTLAMANGLRVRFLGATRWSDYGVFGPQRREKTERAGAYFQSLSRSALGGANLDVPTVRAISDSARVWLQTELAAEHDVDVTVVITHFAPSLRCADPRYGQQPGTASFCNADDALLPMADLWLHGHVHVRHDLSVPRSSQAGDRPMRVISHARGHGRRHESQGHDPARLVEWQMLA